MTQTMNGLIPEFAARLTILDKLFEIDPDRGLAKAADDLLMIPKRKEHFNNLDAYKQQVNDLIAKYCDKCSPEAKTQFGDKIFKAAMDFVQARPAQ